jgi:hypothetical protein
MALAFGGDVYPAPDEEGFMTMEIRESRFAYLELDDDDAPARIGPVEAPRVPALPVPSAPEKVAEAPAPSSVHEKAAEAPAPSSAHEDAARIASAAPAPAAHVPSGMMAQARARLQALAREQARTVPVAPAQSPAAVERDQILAVAAADETTGAVWFWQTVGGDVSVQALADAWTAEGLPARWLCDGPSDDVALRRAVESQKTKDIMIRKHPRGGWAIVREASAGGRLTYGVSVRVYLEAGTVGVCTETGEQNETTAAMRALLLPEFERAKRAHAASDLSAWLVRLASRELSSVALRERGGVYFAPRDEVRTLRAIKRALARAGAHDIHEIPALRSAEAIAAILDAISREVATECATLDGEIAAGDLGVRAARTRIGEIDALAEKVRRYEALLGRPLGDALTRLSALRAQLSGITTRFVNIEID